MLSADSGLDCTELKEYLRQTSRTLISDEHCWYLMLCIHELSLKTISAADSRFSSNKIRVLLNELKKTPFK